MIYVEKLTLQCPFYRENLKMLFDIHPDKLPYEIEHRIGRLFSEGERDGWISVDSRFANFYMTLLATHLSEKIGAGLLTDSAANNRLANAVKLDAKISLPKSRDIPLSVAEGILADLVFERIEIDPETPTKKILKFRREHADALGRFRTKIAELTSSVSQDLPPEALRQKVEDIYLNDVMPAIDSLKKRLTDNKIKWVTENFLKVGFFSTSSTSIPLALLGMATSHALLVGAGISLTASAIRYNRDKAEKLRENPFSYLLAAERKFS